MKKPKTIYVWRDDLKLPKWPYKCHVVELYRPSPEDIGEGMDKRWIEYRLVERTVRKKRSK